MKLGIINSAFYQAGVDTATGLKHIARIGFDSVDIFKEAMTLSKKEKLLSWPLNRSRPPRSMKTVQAKSNWSSRFSST